jgi:hypothetical protein
MNHSGLWRLGALGIALSCCLTLADAGVASAAESLGSPVISGTNWPATYVRPVDGHFKTGVPIALTLSPGSGDTPESYQYQVNESSVQTVTAVDGTAQITITPTGRTGRLSVTAIAADGAASEATVEKFLATAARQAAPQDINGDSIPDLVIDGGTAGLPSGMWMVPGTGDGRGGLGLPATNIGALGQAYNSEPTPADFDGSEIITGQYFGDGFQDFMTYVPAGPYAGRGSLLSGSGDGSVVDPSAGGNVGGGATYFSDENGDWPLQFANAYNAEGVGGFLDDMMTVTGSDAGGYRLNYYEYRARDFVFGVQPLTVTVNTPDGTADWQNWTLATTKTASGTAVYLWKKSTGELYLWNNFTVADINDDSTVTASYTQYEISKHWNKGADVSTLQAADFGSGSTPGLWAVTSNGYVHTYVVRHLNSSPQIKQVASIKIG